MRVNTIARVAPLFLFAFAFTALAGLTGCGVSGPRTLPQQSLVARAWAGREPMPTTRGEAVVAFAWAQVGHRYCWGGLGPSCFDCSGLVDRAWGSVGVRVPRTTGEIASTLPEVALSDVRMGDILWWPGHVGLYAGNGWVIDALDTPHGVVRRAATTPYRAFRPVSEWSYAPDAKYATSR
jgi:cell wall-associated NlpC family hydrolase